MDKKIQLYLLAESKILNTADEHMHKDLHPEDADMFILMKLAITAIFYRSGRRAEGCCYRQPRTPTCPPMPL
jgi:hypothetical protein